jgi:hypothetical protein
MFFFSFFFLEDFAMIQISPYYFLFPETVRRGPFLVRALVLVRCPLAGKDRLCRNPR